MLGSSYLEINGYANMRAKALLKLTLAITPTLTLEFQQVGFDGSIQ